MSSGKDQLKLLQDMLAKLEKETAGGYFSMEKKGKGKGGSRSTGGEIPDMAGNAEGSGLLGGAKRPRGKKAKGGEIPDLAGRGLSGGIEADMAGRGGLLGGKAPKGVTPPQLKKWLDHVKSVRSAHPDKPYKEVLALAKKSY